MVPVSNAMLRLVSDFEVRSKLAEFAQRDLQSVARVKFRHLKSEAKRNRTEKLNPKGLSQTLANAGFGPKTVGVLVLKEYLLDRYVGIRQSQKRRKASEILDQILEDLDLPKAVQYSRPLLRAECKTIIERFLESKAMRKNGVR